MAISYSDIGYLLNSTLEPKPYYSVMVTYDTVLTYHSGYFRTEFISRLTLLKEQWQSVVRMAHQKKSDIDSLVKQWQKFTTLLQDLTKFLMDTNSYVAAVKSQEKYGLDQIRNLNHKFKVRPPTRYNPEKSTIDRISIFLENENGVNLDRCVPRFRFIY